MCLSPQGVAVADRIGRTLRAIQFGRLVPVGTRRCRGMGRRGPPCFVFALSYERGSGILPYETWG